MVKRNTSRHQQFQPRFDTRSLPVSERNTVAHLPHLQTWSDAKIVQKQSSLRRSPGQFVSVYKQSSIERQPGQFVSPPQKYVDAVRSMPAVRGKPDRKRRYIVSGGISLIALIIYLIWFNTRTTDVTLYEVNSQQIIQYVGGGGIAFPYQQLTLSYPVAERAVEVLVKAGDEVSPNQPLLRLDPTQLNAQIQKSSDDVAAAQAYLNAVSTSGNASSIAQAQQQYTLTKSKYNALLAESSFPLLHDGNLISPMHGVITTVNINSGEVFAADAPLLIIMDESTIIVHVKIPLINLSQVHVGQQATVTPAALPDLTLTGTINAVIPQADPQTDTFEIRIRVDNSHRVLLPGMSAFARIQTPGRAMIVPRLGILNPNQQSAAFVIKNQHVYLQHVHVAGQVGDNVLIDAGLATGDRIVLVGLYTLHDGQAIHIRSVEN